MKTGLEKLSCLIGRTLHLTIRESHDGAASDRDITASLVDVDEYGGETFLWIALKELRRESIRDEPNPVIRFSLIRLATVCEMSVYLACGEFDAVTEGWNDYGERKDTQIGTVNSDFNERRD